MNYFPTYSDLYDPAFPQSTVDLRAELLLGGTWTDISKRIYFRDGVSVTYGHPDETSEANPTVASLSLKNADGALSPRNPVGPYYGLLTRNTPMRLSVPQDATYLRLETDTTSYASCPSVAGIRLTGSLDVRIDVDLTNYAQACFASVYSASASVNQRSWEFGISAAGLLFLRYSTDGTASAGATSTIPAPVGRACLRVTLDATTGNVAFYTAPAGNVDTASWTQLGSTSAGSGAVTLFASTVAPLTVGYSVGVVHDHASDIGPVGSVFDFELRSGIGGTVVAHMQPGSQVAGTMTWADAQGNVWSLGGSAELSDRRYRAHVEVPAWPPTWDPTGQDVSTSIQGSGLLRRLRAGTPPLQSAMYRAYNVNAAALALCAYWPCEDGLQSSQLASGLLGGAPMSIFGTVQSASNSSFVCSAALPQLNGSIWTGTVPAQASWPQGLVGMLMQIPSTGEVNGAVCASIFTSGTVSQLDLVYTTASGGQLTVNCYNAAGTLLGAVGPVQYVAVNSATVGVNGQMGQLNLAITQSGSSTNVQLLTYVPFGPSYSLNGTLISSATIGPVTRVVINPNKTLTSTAIGHVAVQTATWQTTINVTFSPFTAWINEAAGTRFARLCAEQGVPSRIYGYAADTVAMGYQLPGAFVDLLQECEDADRGLMFEPKQALALGYRTRPSMFNQAAALALAYDSAQLSSPIAPTDDDLLIQNDLTVTRAGGSSYGATQTDGPLSVLDPPDGVGDYGQAVTVSLGSDAQLPDEAGWLLHMGTVDDVRYPSLSVNLSRSELQPVYDAAQDVRVGDRITVSGTPGFLPPDGVSQVIRGGTETVYGFTFTETWNCAPEQPYRVGVYDDPVLGHADTDGSTLVGNYTATATTLSVATTGAATGSPLWTTDSDDFPFDVIASGERMTVTGITGTTSPQTFTVTRSVNGVVKPQSSGADVRLFQPAIASM